MQQRIQHRTIRVTGTRVNDQVARLIDDEDIIIFIYNIEWDILRFKADLFVDFSIDSDGLATHDFFFRLVWNFAIDLNALVEDPLFYARSRIIREHFGQSLI